MRKGEGTNAATHRLTGGLHLQSRDEQDAIQHALEGQIARHLETLKRLGRFPKKGLDMAIDMHLIPRYDRVPGAELTRSKYKNGTKYLSVT